MTEMPLSEVGALAAARRRELKLDRAALARKAHVDPKTVRALEEGERWPRDKSRTQIESALDWPAGALERLRNKEPFPVKIDHEYLTRPRPPRDFEAELARLTSSRPQPGYGGESIRIRARLAGIPEDEWPDEDRSYLREAAAEHDRRTALAQRAVDEWPLIDLVWEGQQLAAGKTDPEVRAYVRKVESAVVRMVGIDQLNDQLETRRAEHLIIRANQGGVLVPLMEEAERLREAGLTDRDITRSMALKLEELLAAPRPAPTLEERATALHPIDFDVAWPPARDMVIEVDHDLEWALSGNVLAEYRLALSELRDDLGSPDGIERFIDVALEFARTTGREAEVFELMARHAPPEVALAARRPAGHPKGLAEQGEASGEENQDLDASVDDTEARDLGERLDAYTTPEAMGVDDRGHRRHKRG